MGLTVTQLSIDFGGSNPSPPTQKNAEVAQLIEHQPSKLRVASLSLVFRSKQEKCLCSSVVEHFLGKEEVAGSIPAIGSGEVAAFNSGISAKRKNILKKKLIINKK